MDGTKVHNSDSVLVIVIFKTDNEYLSTLAARVVVVGIIRSRHSQTQIIIIFNALYLPVAADYSRCYLVT